LGIDADILEYSENEDRLSMKINSVDLFTVKRSKKVVEILFSGAIVYIESIGGISYKEYVMKSEHEEGTYRLELYVLLSGTGHQILLRLTFFRD